MVYRRNKSTWDVRMLSKTLKDFVNHSPPACALSVFSRVLPRGFIAPVDP